MNENYKKYYTTNFGENKGKCLNITTFTRKKLTLNQQYDLLKENDLGPSDDLPDGYFRKNDTIFYIYPIEDWLNTCKKNAWAMQASAGLNHVRRDVLIRDVDQELTKEGHLAAVSNFCFTQKILLPTYIIYNKKTAHAQFGWVLKDPMNNKDLNYMKLVHALNKDGGDQGFTGWQCKNPYYVEACVEFLSPNENGPRTFDVSKFMHLTVPPVTVVQNTAPVSDPISVYNNNNNNSLPSLPYVVNVTSKNKSKGNHTKIMDKPHGRNCTLFLELCKLVYFNEFKTPEATFKWARTRANELVKEQPKDHGMPDSEIMATVNSVWRYKNTNTLRPGHYTPEQVKHGQQKGLVTRRERAAAMAAQAKEMLASGMSKTAVAAELDVSRMTIDRWLANSVVSQHSGELTAASTALEDYNNNNNLSLYSLPLCSKCYNSEFTVIITQLDDDNYEPDDYNPYKLLLNNREYKVNIKNIMLMELKNDKKS